MNIRCDKCLAENPEESRFCSNCGASLRKDQIVVTVNNNENHTNNKITCPVCGSDNIHFVTTQASQNFDKGDACCGFLLCGPLGLLCGVKDKTESKTVRKCLSCNHEF